MIEELFRTVPTELLHKSGSVFYSGRDAFSNPSRLYLLGLNPAGSPVEMAEDTVSRHSDSVLYDKPANWSEYRDVSWEGAPPGTKRMQRSVLHLLDRLNIDPGRVPSSNLIFVRSARKMKPQGHDRALAEACWTFHERVIYDLDINVVLCFGQDTGNLVRKKLGADELLETFVEDNARGWTSQALRSPSGVGVVIATHPSWVAWYTPAADPTHLVEHLLTSSATVAKRPR